MYHRKVLADVYKRQREKRIQNVFEEHKVRKQKPLAKRKRHLLNSTVTLTVRLPVSIYRF